MLVNLHTHTPRCRHAVGTEEEYVQYALQCGLQVLGFSDHTPYWFPGDYYSYMRMYPQELTGYIETVKDLQHKYADKLDIRLGLEVEYYPDLFPDLMSRIRDAGIEYILLGQHWNGNEMNEPYNGSATEDEHILEKYCNQVIKAMETEPFTYLAHPDLLHFVGDDQIYRRHMRRLCIAAKRCGLPLEINLLGLREGRHYPKSLFWDIAAEEGCNVVLGSDAHRPEHVVDPVTESLAIKMIQEKGLAFLDRPQIRHI